jgi:RimJ/RimL family protein N-acetyltransferase
MTTSLKPAARPDRVTLDGRYARIVPISENHAAGIYMAASGAANDDLWLWMAEGPFATRQEFDAAWERKLASADPMFYSVLDAPTGHPLGYASLMRIDTSNACIEVGNIMYSPLLQRTPAATEAQYLLARYVFEDLGNRRYEWKCNSLNEPSRRAALRYGFRFEGIFRQHMIVKGKNRDTAWFSLLDREWPVRKAAFEAWLDPGNFDENGRQKSRLGAGGIAQP